MIGRSPRGFASKPPLKNQKGFGAQPQMGLGDSPNVFIAKLNNITSDHHKINRQIA
jgi:hypothetical protein